MGIAETEIYVVFDRIPGIAVAVAAETEALVDEVRHELLAEADARVPVLTGNLQESGHIDGEYVIYDATDEQGNYYGVFVEEGTRFQAAQPYLTPAAEAVAPMLPAGFEIIVGSL